MKNWDIAECPTGFDFGEAMNLTTIVALKFLAIAPVVAFSDITSANSKSSREFKSVSASTRSFGIGEQQFSISNFASDQIQTNFRTGYQINTQVGRRLLISSNESDHAIIEIPPNVHPITIAQKSDAPFNIGSGLSDWPGCGTKPKPNTKLIDFGTICVLETRPDKFSVSFGAEPVQWGAANWTNSTPIYIKAARTSADEFIIAVIVRSEQNLGDDFKGALLLHDELEEPILLPSGIIFKNRVRLVFQADQLDKLIHSEDSIWPVLRGMAKADESSVTIGDKEYMLDESSKLGLTHMMDLIELHRSELKLNN